MPVAKQVEFLLREKRSKKVKRNPVPDEFRCTAVDEFYPDEREVLVSLLRRFDFSCNRISGLERMCLDLSL